MQNWIVSVLLVGLRVAPLFAFAPPFSLVPVPRLVKLLFGLALSVCLVAAVPRVTMLADPRTSTVILAAMPELMLGSMFVLSFHLAFAALYLAGRTIDIQAGYGLALVIDPASQAQMPLSGSLFAYAAAAVFFAQGGHLSVLRLFAASFEAFPLGTWTVPHSIAPVTAFLSVTCVAALGIAGGPLVILFLADLTIALMSRTVPQMNVLVLGLQVKTVLFLLALPICFGAGAAWIAQLMAMTLMAIPGLL